MAVDLAALRAEYTKGALEVADLAPEPLDQLRLWLEQAQSAELLEPNAMTLATADAEGQPFTRTVLLKQLDARGLVFFTNLHSRKGQQLAQNPRASLLFCWLPLERQISVNGIARPISRQETLAYFITRPLGSRLGAWSSPQSQVITSRSLLEGKWAEFKQKFADGQVPLPDFWGGYRLEPTSVEVWQGRPNRLHDRFLYQRVENGWQVDRLAP